MEPESSKATTRTDVYNYFSDWVRDNPPLEHLAYMREWQIAFNRGWNKLTSEECRRFFSLEADLQNASRRWGSRLILPCRINGRPFALNFSGPHHSLEQCSAHLNEGLAGGPAHSTGTALAHEYSGIIALLEERENRISKRLEWQVKLLLQLPSLAKSLQVGFDAIAGENTGVRSGLAFSIERKIREQGLPPFSYRIDDVAGPINLSSLESTLPKPGLRGDKGPTSTPLPSLITCVTGEYALAYFMTQRRAPELEMYGALLAELRNTTESFDIGGVQVRIPRGFLEQRMMVARSTSCKLALEVLELPRGNSSHIRKIFIQD
ncbi:MAG: hypothetical protein DCC75_01545 [Proteobacteria bacterium]|nr:MAG: hypothetical protein DCC75_01545 [Pseudomonadota bacterium]